MFMGPSGPRYRDAIEQILFTISGAHINTTESVVLSLAGDSSHPNFKEIQVPSN